MDALQTLINALVIASVGTVLAWMVSGLRRETREAIARVRVEVQGVWEEFRGELATLRGEMGSLREEFRGELTGLREEFRGELAEVRKDLRLIRSDLTQVALAVGVRPRAGNE